MIKQQIYIKPDQAIQIEARMKWWGMTKSQVIRRLIREGIKSYETTKS